MCLWPKVSHILTFIDICNTIQYIFVIQILYFELYIWPKRLWHFCRFNCKMYSLGNCLDLSINLQNQICENPARVFQPLLVPTSIGISHKCRTFKFFLFSCLHIFSNVEHLSCAENKYCPYYRNRDQTFILKWTFWYRWVIMKNHKYIPRNLSSKLNIWETDQNSFLFFV